MICTSTSPPKPTPWVGGRRRGLTKGRRNEANSGATVKANRRTLE
jgi:hypothetical protein